VRHYLPGRKENRAIRHRQKASQAVGAQSRAASVVFSVGIGLSLVSCIILSQIRDPETKPNQTTKVFFPGPNLEGDMRIWIHSVRRPTNNSPDRILRSQYFQILTWCDDMNWGPNTSKILIRSETSGTWIEVPINSIS
jgi:hypothetical protein